MARTLEFYFDFGSPNAHLAHELIPPILQRTGASLERRIMLLGGVFQATGNASPVALPARAPYTVLDITRYVNKYKIPFRLNPHFPVNTLKAMRGAVAAEEDGVLPQYMDALFRAMWIDGLNVAEDQALAAALRTGALDDARFLQRIGEDSVKDKLKRYTADAVARGVFGSPTFFVGDEMFFGKDRLDFVEEALLGRSYSGNG